MMRIKPGTLFRFHEDALVGPPDDERVVTYRLSDRKSFTWFPSQIFLFVSLEKVLPKAAGRTAWYIHFLAEDSVHYKRLFETVDSLEAQVEVVL